MLVPTRRGTICSGQNELRPLYPGRVMNTQDSDDEFGKLERSRFPGTHFRSGKKRCLHGRWSLMSIAGMPTPPNRLRSVQAFIHRGEVRDEYLPLIEGSADRLGV